MPIYEYICQKCGQEIEAIQKVSEAPLTQHDDCGGKLEKKLSLSAFHLKGGGWYADGYSQKSSKPDKKEPKTSSDDKKTTSKKKEKTPSS